jgi:hypothetical protein
MPSAPRGVDIRSPAAEPFVPRSKRASVPAGRLFHEQWIATGAGCAVQVRLRVSGASRGVAEATTVVGAVVTRVVATATSLVVSPAVGVAVAGSVAGSLPLPSLETSPAARLMVVVVDGTDDTGPATAFVALVEGATGVPIVDDDRSAELLVFEAALEGAMALDRFVNANAPTPSEASASAESPKVDRRFTFSVSASSAPDRAASRNLEEMRVRSGLVRFGSELKRVGVELELVSQFRLVEAELGWVIQHRAELPPRVIVHECRHSGKGI